MYNFRKPTFTRSVMFSVNFEDGRTAYLAVQNHGTSDQDYLVPAIVRERQQQGVLPEGEVTTIKRVR